MVAQVLGPIRIISPSRSSAAVAEGLGNANFPDNDIPRTSAIESNYAAYITEFADEHARSFLPDLSAPVPAVDNVVALER